MRATFKVLWITVTIAAGLVGCRTRSPGGRTLSAIPVVDAAAAQRAGLSFEQVSAARELYTAKCARCHKFYDPAPYSDAEWRLWMRKMSKKAKLQPDQEELLSRYLELFRSGPVAEGRS